MVELVNLIAIGLAVICVVLVIGSRDRMRTLEFRLALIERRLREAQAAASGSGTPAATELPPEPDSSIVPDPRVAPATDEPAEPAASPPPSRPQTEPVASAVAAPGPSLEERFGTQWVVWAGGIA